MGVQQPGAWRAVALAVGVVCAGSAWAQQGAVQPGASAELGEVIVSGARSERALLDVPATVDVITAQDLDPAQVQDIRDLVRELPNVSVRRAPQRFGGVMGQTGREGNAGFNIRGLEGNRVLLAVDGIRIPQALSSGVMGSAAFGRDYFDLGLISRVEIVRGASSALYGSDGLAGMVAMFTTEPEELLRDGQTLGGRLHAGYDTEDEGQRVGLTLAGRASDTVQWLGSVQWGRSQALDNQGDNQAPNLNRTAPNPQDDERQAVLAKVVLTPGGGNRHTLTLEHVQRSSVTEVLSGRAVALTAPTHVADLDGTDDMERTRLSWDGRWRLGTAWADEVRAVLGWQSAQSQQVATEIRPLQAVVANRTRVRDVTYSEETWQAVLQAEKTRPVAQGQWTQKLVYGLDWSQTSMDSLLTGLVPPVSETFPARRFPQTDVTTTALFLQSEWASERWSVIPALRYDHIELDARPSAGYRLQPSSLTASSWSPKLGVIWRAAPSWSVFGNWAAGFKAPEPLQLNNSFEMLVGQPYRLIPNPNLRPERSQTLELGARGSQGAVSWSAAVFTGRYRDFIEENVPVGGAGTVTDPSLRQAINRQQVRIHGVELTGAYRLSPSTTLRMAYGQTEGRDTSRQQALNSVNPAQWVLGLDHRHGAWTWGAVVRHVEAKSRSDIDFSSIPNQFAPAAHTTLDLTAQWQITRAWQLSAALRNVTDRKYWEWGNVQGQLANAATLDAFTSPGRSLSVAVSHRF